MSLFVLRPDRIVDTAKLRSLSMSSCWLLVSAVKTSQTFPVFGETGEAGLESKGGTPAETDVSHGLSSPGLPYALSGTPITFKRTEFSDEGDDCVTTIPGFLDKGQGRQARSTGVTSAGETESDESFKRRHGGVGRRGCSPWDPFVKAG